MRRTTARRSLLVATVLAAGLSAGAAAAVPEDLALTLLTDDLVQPLGLATAGDDRLFVVERPGRIVVWRPGGVLPEPFLDIRGLVDSDDGEQGLLGLAFHPDYRRNGFFYVAYVRDLSPRHPQQHEKVIARYNVSADPDVADPGSQELVMVLAQPYPNHNGGDLHFGRDGYLYAGTGDGGGGGDPFDNGQNVDSLLGKILRLDVDRDDFPNDPQRNYGVPPDNPFADEAGADEIWTYGLRNPWRFSFDRRTGELWIGDVGQNEREEVDLLPAGEGGQNLGWDCWEGTARYHQGGNLVCPDESTLVWPVLEYGHGQGCSVTGGYRYRGHVIAALAGQYLFGDFCSGRLWLAERRGGSWASTFWRQAGNVSSFGEDERGELYVLDFGGRLLRVTSAGSLFFDDFEDGGLAAWTRVVRGHPAAGGAADAR